MKKCSKSTTIKDDWRTDDAEDLSDQQRSFSEHAHRFYQMQVAQGIFGDWSLIVEWGRIGSPGTVRKAWFFTEREALQAEQRLCA